MAAPRNKSISTKVTDEEYARFEALAGEQTISEWARDALLKTAEPSAADQTIVAELLALRMILLNVLFSIANHESVTEEADAGHHPPRRRAQAGKSAGAADEPNYGTTGGMMP